MVCGGAAVAELCGARGACAGLPLGRRGRDENAGLQRLAAVGHGLCRPSPARNGHARPRKGRPGARARVPRVVAGPRRNAPECQVLPPCVARRVAVLDPRARVADLGLHRRGAQVGARAPDPELHRLDSCLARPPQGGHQRGALAPKPPRGRRLGDIREPARAAVPRAHEPLRGLRRHHDRLRVRRVHVRLDPSPLRVPQAVPRPSQARNHPRHRRWARVYPLVAAP
eukprot:Amastigsp_a676535_8.p3 type:complete len:227 gc:universal Amastigsp_a676535_8:347-1027(+)